MIAKPKPQSHLVSLDPPQRLVGNRSGEPAAAMAIGQTPLLKLGRLADRIGLPSHVELWLKGEWTNPGGSIKDRPALAIVKAALARGDLAEGKILLDATSGNTGIAYAMLGAAYGFPVELVLPETASDERKTILRSYGAHVVLSDPYEGSNGAIRHARALAAEHPDRYFYADQYSNPANPSCAFHDHWTRNLAPDRRPDHPFCRWAGNDRHDDGCWRLLEVSQRRRFRSWRSNQQNRSMGSRASNTCQPRSFRRSMTMRFPTCRLASIPKMPTRSPANWRCWKGFFAGTSTGAALAAAARIGRELEPSDGQAVIVAIAPDGGGKYLSTELWG